MRNIWTVFTHELWVNISRKGFLFMTFGVPLIAFALLFVVNITRTQESAEQNTNDILNQFDFEGIQIAGLVDTGNVFPTISDALQRVIIRYPDVDSANAALSAGDIDVFYDISPDYLTTQEVTLHLPSVNVSLINTQPIQQLFYTTLAGDLNPELLRRLRATTTIEQFNVTMNENQVNDEEANFVLLYAFVMIFMLTVFTTNGYLIQSVIEEKENRVIEILVTTIRPGELLAGKILGNGFTGIIQVVVWAGAFILGLELAGALPGLQTIAVIANIRIPYEQLPLMFVYFLLGYLLFAGVFAAIGAISNSMREGPGYAAMFTLPSVIPFYLFGVFTTTPNATAPVVLSMIPITAPISMLMRLSVTSVPLVEILASIGILGLSVVGMMWAAGRIFRVQSLLSGQMPKLREIPKLIFGK
jgi:ABC-2 type transport system permease protein